MLRNISTSTLTKSCTSSCVLIRRFIHPSPARLEDQTKSKSPYGQQMGGYEHRPAIGGVKNKWRKAFEERGFWQSKIGLFDSRDFKGDKFAKLNPDNFRFFKSPAQWWQSHVKKKLIYDQQFSEPRLSILGPDLAAAHFTVFRGGAVKFYNSEKWIKDDTKLKNEYDVDLPNTYDAKYVIEALDLSKTPILYEGLVNLERLRKLKWLSVSGCPHFDNWCLDKISAEYSDSLEHLDLSYTNVSYSGLNALYRFRKLKTLVLDDLSEDVEYFQMCSELKKCMPGLTIEGVPCELYADSDESKQLESSG